MHTKEVAERFEEICQANTIVRHFVNLLRSYPQRSGVAALWLQTVVLAAYDQGWLDREIVKTESGMTRTGYALKVIDEL